eukprot:GHVT01092050.1.p2 GENE.GHVT01092050.1~~GHVT01092050.1.p2  ORF type:complete len:168 (-),score=3.15 GHVT01092050.1:241-744(-)
MMGMRALVETEITTATTEGIGSPLDYVTGVDQKDTSYEIAQRRTPVEIILAGTTTVVTTTVVTTIAVMIIAETTMAEIITVGTMIKVVRMTTVEGVVMVKTITMVTQTTTMIAVEMMAPIIDEVTALAVEVPKEVPTGILERMYELKKKNQNRVRSRQLVKHPEYGW